MSGARTAPSWPRRPPAGIRAPGINGRHGARTHADASCMGALLLHLINRPIMMGMCVWGRTAAVRRRMISAMNAPPPPDPSKIQRRAGGGGDAAFTPRAPYLNQYYVRLPYAIDP